MSIIRLSSGESLHHFCTRTGGKYGNTLRKLDDGLSPDEAAKWDAEHRGKKDFNRKYFYKGYYVGELLDGYNGRLYKNFLAKMQHHHDMERALRPYKEIVESNLLKKKGI